MLLLAATVLSAGDNSNNNAEHLLYLADQGFAVIRLRIEIDGRSQRELYREFVFDLCRKADQDQDGLLTAEEYAAGIAAHPAIQSTSTRAVPRSGALPQRAEFPSGKVAVEAAASYLLRRVLTPLRVEFSSQRMQRINQAGVMQDRPLADRQLFERLDSDGNRKLTSRELERAAVVLGRLDLDEDDILTQAEIQLELPAVAMTPTVSNPDQRRRDAYLSPLSPEQIDASFVRRVFSLYDGAAKGTAKDQRLEHAEIRMAPPQFAFGDADQDGFWDYDELRRFLERPETSAELHAQFFSDARPSSATFTADDAQDSIRLIAERSASVVFEIYGTRFQLQLPHSAVEQNQEQPLKLQFQALDANKNEYLEASELGSSETGDGSEPTDFARMDANGDQQVTFTEFLAYYRRSVSLRDGPCTLVVENLGRTLFGPLDLNGDGRLSQRELSQLKARLPEWDANGDGKLEEAEIPQQYRLTLSRGSGGATSPQTTELGINPSPATSPSAGPLWFRKMDRNRDGEVSVREFLGAKPRFEEIDTNGDGAIDADEAGKVK